MKIKLLLALAIVAVLVTITTAGYLVRSYLKEPEDLAGAQRSTSERVLDDLASVVGLETEAVEPEQGTRQAALEQAPNVRGRVDLFGACAEQRGITVYAMNRPASLEALMASLAAENGLGNGDADLLLTRTTVDATGEFELSLERDTARVHVIAAGLHGYQLESQPVSIESGTARATLTPYCGSCVTGRVFLPAEGAASPLPAKGAEVRLTTLRRGQSVGSRRLVRITQTDQLGGFELPALPLPGDYQVEVNAEGFASARRDATDLVAGESQALDFHLTAGAEVTGRVVDPAGKPIAEAEVLAFVAGTVGRSSFGRRTTLTDEGGHFTLSALAAERVTFEASKDSYLESAQLRLELGEGEQSNGVLLVLEPGAEVAGRVNWPDGSPVVDELVEVSFDRSRSLARFGSLNASTGGYGEARTDASGHFRVTGLGKGPFSVTVGAAPREMTAANATDEQRWRTRADEVAPGTSDLELVLAPPLGLDGSVRNAAGEALENFTLRSVLMMETEIGVLARDDRDDSFPIDAGARTSAANGESTGEFRLLSLSAGRWSFYASAEGYATSEPITRELPDEANLPLEFTLEQQATISGLVLSPRGAPIAGATITLDDDGPSWRPLASGAPSAPRTTSADDGSFEISGLPSGDLYLLASASGHASSPPTAFPLAPGDRLDNVELTLREGAILTGEVFGSENRPIPGALVQLISSPDFDVMLEHADERGRFEFVNLAPGTWQVIAMPARERLQSIARDEGDTASAVLGEMEVAIVEVVDGGVEHVVLGESPADPLQLTGLVLGDGAPQPNVVLGFFKAGTDIHEQNRRTAANAKGEFSIVLDGGGSYVISAARSLSGGMDECNIEFQVEIPEGDAHELTLQLPGGALRGMLVDASGAPASHARVTLSPRGATSSDSVHSRFSTQTRTDETGHYEITFIPAGDYTLAAGGMNSGGLFERTAKFGRVLRAVQLSEGERLQVEKITLPAASTVRVRVHDEGARPMEGAAIFARGEDGELVEVIAMSTTGPAGACDYQGLAPGRYSFSARLGDLASTESELVEVSAEATAEVSLELQEGTMLVVQLRGAENQPVLGEIYLYDDEGRELQRMRSLHDVLRTSDGREFERSEKRFGPLAPGKYRVVASRDGLRDRRPVVLNGRTERKLTLRLR
jgi:Carboxypeptidase regulatory-like domain